MTADPGLLDDAHPGGAESVEREDRLSLAIRERGRFVEQTLRRRRADRGSLRLGGRHVRLLSSPDSQFASASSCGLHVAARAGCVVDRVLAGIGLPRHHGLCRMHRQQSQRAGRVAGGATGARPVPPREAVPKASSVEPAVAEASTTPGPRQTATIFGIRVGASRSVRPDRLDRSPRAERGGVVARMAGRLVSGVARDPAGGLPDCLPESTHRGVLSSSFVVVSSLLRTLPAPPPRNAPPRSIRGASGSAAAGRAEEARCRPLCRARSRRDARASGDAPGACARPGGGYLEAAVRRGRGWKSPEGRGVFAAWRRARTAGAGRSRSRRTAASDT